MSFVSNLSVGRKLYAAFAAVSIIFAVALVVTIVYGQQSRSAWHKAEGWNVAVANMGEVAASSRSKPPPREDAEGPRAAAGPLYLPHVLQRPLHLALRIPLRDVAPLVALLLAAAPPAPP